MRGALAALLLLGVATEGALLNLLWSEVRAAWRGGWAMDPGLALFLASPLLLAGLGAVAARALHRRGSTLAWVAVGLPVAILLGLLGLAVALTLNPLGNHH